MSASPITVMAFDDAHTFEEATPATLAAAREFVGQRRVVWINIDTVESPEVLASLERDFGIHPLTAEDVRNTHQRPKVEQYPTYMYVVTQMLRRLKDGTLETEQVSMLLGDGWVITLQESSGDVFDDVRARLRAGRPRIRTSGVDYMFYTLLDAIVDAYFPVLEQVGDRSERLEEMVIEESPELNMREELQIMKRELLTIRRVAWPQRDAIAAVERGENPLITAETRTFLRDVTDHANRVLDLTETQRELTASLMDLYLASVAQRTNDTMRVLTIVATIFIPLTFIAGVYGMNFRIMPELNWRYGYAFAWVVMGAVGAAMFFGFRKRGWL